MDDHPIYLSINIFIMYIWFMMYSIYIWYHCSQQGNLTFLRGSDGDGLGGELLIKVACVRLWRHLRHEGRHQLGDRKQVSVHQARRQETGQCAPARRQETGSVWHQCCHDVLAARLAPERRSNGQCTLGRLEDSRLRQTGLWRLEPPRCFKV